MRWVVLPRAPVSIAVAVLVVVVLAYLGISSHKEKQNIKGESMLTKGIEQTRNSKSFRYKITSRLVSEKDGETYLSRVTGEQVAPDRVHIKGILINTPIELVQIADTAYIKDQMTGKWIKLQGNRFAQTELFITEINPLGVFNFKDVPILDYKGRDRQGGKKFDLLEFEPVVQNPFLETQFADFAYKVWLYPQDHRIRKVNLQARSKNDETQKLIIDIEVWDYDKKIEINPPI
ncbi:MAG: hypothetical protein AB1327_04840 [Bacillota bacterium]|uniref:hypothetical protein n=1 Tax=Desulforudis sp. DRI-14 TaxID=3459793 RepID=UPI00348C160F